MVASKIKSLLLSFDYFDKTYHGWRCLNWAGKSLGIIALNRYSISNCLSASKFG